MNKVIPFKNSEEATHAEAAAFLGISEQTLYNRCNKRKGPRRIRRFGKIFYPWPDLTAYKKMQEEVIEAYS